MKKVFFLAFVLLSFIACEKNKPITGSEKSVEEIKGADKISSIIRNPVSANKPLDTVNVAKMTFDEVAYDFGTVDEGAKVKHTYKFTNTGKVNLLISNAKSTCGCTVPEWPKHPIRPGESEEIRVVFDTKGKKNHQSKPITINANTYPSETKVVIKGTVNPK